MRRPALPSFDRPSFDRPSKKPSAFGGWLTLIVVVGHLVFRVLPVAIAFVVATAFLAPHIERLRWLAAAGVAIVLVPGLLLRWRLDGFIERLGRSWLAPSLLDLTTLTASATCVLFCLGMADATGRSLRRHGDWFLGEHNGFVARSVRAGIASAAAALEKFDPPPEVAPVVFPMVPGDAPGPWVDPPPADGTLVFYHPLAGPRRAMPLYASRRFGAARPQPRPAECELGHCGVDLGTTLGEPVFAIADGVIERIELDETAGGRAGKYIRMSHPRNGKDGTLVSRYIHLDSARADLRVGMTVRGGELIGRLGRSGVEHSGAHLHFGLSIRESGVPGGKERYIDPEPLLRTWRLPEAPAALVAQR